MNRDRVIQIIALLAVVFGLAASATLTPRISAEAGRAQLAYTVSATEGDPPEVALGVAMDVPIFAEDHVIDEAQRGGV